MVLLQFNDTKLVLRFVYELSIEQEQIADSFDYNPNPKCNVCILFADC